MKVDGSYIFPAPPERVWALLLDPDALAATIPGCQQLDPLGNDQYVATLNVGVAAIKGTYTGKVSVKEQQPPTSFDLVIESRGRKGFITGVGHISLEPQGDDATLVSVEGDAQVGGPIFTVGSRLVVPTAKMLMKQFFEAMKRRLEDGAVDVAMPKS